MASASNSSAAAYDRSNGGAGGKFRKRPFRTTSLTPYDRPPTALRPTQINNNGWLSKIVDPASKLITAGAHKLFSSVFRKRLLPPPPSPPPQPSSDEGKELQYVEPQTAATVVASASKVPVDCRGNDGSRSFDTNGVAELEDLLKHKTFTRSEIDHLSALLLSRTTENSDGAEKGRSEANVSGPHAVLARHDEQSNVPVHDNRIEHALSAAISTPEVRSKVLRDDVASPAEIAKAYMGSRPMKVSPLTLCLQNQGPKEDLPTPYNPLSSAISPAMSLSEKPVSDVGTSSNGFMTPRFRGRSAIYSMARTPYSRSHHATALKAAETNSNIGGGSPYHIVTENNQAKKQVLKRRSSVLENDIGSVGPIRRIRQKSNLLYPKTLSLPPHGGHQAIHVSGVLANISEVPSSMAWSQNRSFSKRPTENGMPGTSSGYVPSQSIERAQKIFEHLDNLTPKGTPDKKADVPIGNSPTKKPGMGNVDSPRPLQSRQDINGSLDNVHARNYVPRTSSIVEEESTKNFVIPSVSHGPQDGVEGSCLSTQSKAAHHMMPSSIAERPQKKRVFQMSAHEDFLELDDDVPSNEVAMSTQVIEERQHAESSRKSVTFPDILPQYQTTVEKPPEMKTSEQLGEKELECRANGFLASETITSVTPSVVSSSLLGTNRATVDFSTPPNEIRNIPTAFSSKPDNILPFYHASPSAVETEPSIRVLGDTTGPGMTDDKTHKSTQVCSNAVIKSGDPPSVEGLLNRSQTNQSIPSNGFPSTFAGTADASCPVLFASSSKSQSSAPASLSSSSPASNLKLHKFGAQPEFQPSTSAGGTTSTSHLSGSISAPSSFSFASTCPSPSGTLTTSAPVNTDIGLVNTVSSHLDTKPSAFGIGGDSNSEALGNTGGDVQTAGPVGSSRFPFQLQTGSTQDSALASSFTGNSASSVSAPTSTFALSFPGQSASSVSAPASTAALSGLSASSVSAPSSTTAMSSAGPSAASSPAFVFCNSVSSGFNAGSVSANPFSAVSSTSGSSLTNTSGSASIPTSSVFGFTTQTSKPTTTAPAPSFSFGLVSSGVSTSPGVFGATSSSVTSSSPPFVFGSTSGASTPAFASTPSTNGDQTNMEDSMAEDSLQASAPAPSPFGTVSASAFGIPAPTFGASVLAFGGSTSASVFGPSASSSPFGTSSPAPPFGSSTPALTFGASGSAPAPIFGVSSGSAPAPIFGVSSGSAPAPVFGTSVPAAPAAFAFSATPAGSPFQFSTQQSPAAPQNPSFQPSGSLEFNGGTNSFSLGTNDHSLGSDRSGRKIFKAKRATRRK